MIYLNGIESIIESIYLDEPLGKRSSSCNIFVNPDKVDYLAGKIIIINQSNYPAENLERLKLYGCDIITRVQIPGYDFQPYILRICNKIMWNGREIGSNIDLQDLLAKDYCTYSEEDHTLYFPKVHVKDDMPVSDQYGNLTSFGWAFQQVGINIKTDTVFKNLDIIKSQKVSF